MYISASSYPLKRPQEIHRSRRFRLKAMKLIVLFVLISMVTAFAAFAHAYAGSNPVKQHQKQDNIVPIVSNVTMSAHFVEVESGDTLWDIAKLHKKKSDDIRSYIYEIKQVNHLKSNVLKVGQLIILPS